MRTLKPYLIVFSSYSSSFPSLYHSKLILMFSFLSLRSSFLLCHDLFYRMFIFLKFLIYLHISFHLSTRRIGSIINSIFFFSALSWVFPSIQTLSDFIDSVYSPNPFIFSTLCSLHWNQTQILSPSQNSFWTMENFLRHHFLIQYWSAFVCTEEACDTKVVDSVEKSIVVAQQNSLHC